MLVVLRNSEEAGELENSRRGARGSLRGQRRSQELDTATSTRPSQGGGFSFSEWKTRE